MRFLLDKLLQLMQTLPSFPITSQQCDNNITTMWQHYHNKVTITSQQCHNNITTSSQQCETMWKQYHNNARRRVTFFIYYMMIVNNTKQCSISKKKHVLLGLLCCILTTSTRVYTVHADQWPSKSTSMHSFYMVFCPIFNEIGKMVCNSPRIV